MLWSALAFVLWLPALIGWGSPLLLAAVRRMPVNTSPVNLLYAVFFGLATLILAANALNFWIPISPPVSLAALVVGWLLVGLNRQGLWVVLVGTPGPRATLKRVVAAVTAALLLVGFSALVAQQPLVLYDAGLYHLQSVKWLTESAAPLGLANLHGRLGFNSSWFSAAAILELPFMVGKSSFVLNGIVFLAFGSSVILVLRRGLRHALPASDWYLMATVPLWLGAASLQEMSAPSPEVPIIFLSLILIYTLLHAFEDRTQRAFALFVTIVLCTLAITIKLSAVPLMLVPAVICLLCLRHRTWRSVLRVVFFALIPSIVLGGVWAARGIVLSGCLVYPVEITCLHTAEWTVPSAQVESEALWIRSWARSPGNLDRDSVLSGWDWFAPWLRGLVYNNLVVWRGKTALFRTAALLMIIGVLAGLAALRRRTRQPLSGSQVPYLTAGGTVGISFAYWFVTAPEPRFAYGLVSVAAALILCSCLERLCASRGVCRARATHRIAAVIGLYMAFYSAFSGSSAVLRTYITLDAWPGVPSPEIAGPPPELVHTNQNIPVYSPAPNGNDHCWDTPRPCTPHLDARLRIEIDPDGDFRAFYPPH